MAGDTVITVIGNLTGDPELRYTPAGAAVANFTISLIKSKVFVENWQTCPGRQEK